MADGEPNRHRPWDAGCVLWQVSVVLAAPWEEQYVANHTAAVLRGECRARGLGATGTKGDMARRLAAAGFDPRELRITAGGNLAALAAACGILGIGTDGDAVTLAKRIVTHVGDAAPPV